MDGFRQTKLKPNLLPVCALPYLCLSLCYSSTNLVHNNIMLLLITYVRIYVRYVQSSYKAITWGCTFPVTYRTNKIKTIMWEILWCCIQRKKKYINKTCRKHPLRNDKQNRRLKIACKRLTYRHYCRMITKWIKIVLLLS